jgi:hypothetical protein
MPAPKDFRAYAFDPRRVDAAGRNIGQHVYWRLYAIENMLRVITHSVLSAQIGAHWWAVAVAPTIQGKVARTKSDYATRPWHSTPGKHDIYYVFLSDLSKIIAANSHLFAPTIPDIDQWIARLEQVRLPRNIVGHMNWPHKTDRQRIDVVHADLHQLLGQLVASGIVLSAP